ncbi:JM147 [macacine gammaherpesvirus 11]|uniref:JM147 n=2 Tax=macacine gammaherpesvirus 11 TaxID=2560570 RepID=G9JMX4_9GAMA|nr:JM147 [Macaca fuscata rhadinovirus]AAT00124.1 JM147 [Macaca fuscata rhadinovirus]AEW87671.1 JM147 [Macaca fuscata rhadinovirus]AEW87841.1 JM147 [Macaca fuscata rhadinovirus]
MYSWGEFRTMERKMSLRVTRGSQKHITMGLFGAHKRAVGNGLGGAPAPPCARNLGRGVRRGSPKHVLMVAARTHRPLFGAGVIRRSAQNVAHGTHCTHGAHEGGGVAGRSHRAGRGARRLWHRASDVYGRNPLSRGIKGRRQGRFPLARRAVNQTDARRRLVVATVGFLLRCRVPSRDWLGDLSIKNARRPLAQPPVNHGILAANWPKQTANPRVGFCLQVPLYYIYSIIFFPC